MSDSLFESALARLRARRAVQTAALGGSVLLTLPQVAACVPTASPDTDLVESFDWAQYEGKRDTRMVSFTGTWWSDCTSNTRFGCGSLAIHMNIRVRPVASANLDTKRVGIVYKSPDDSTERTALAGYRYSYPNGDEEWNVTIDVPSWQSVVVFDTWYQDGAGSTWIDDNEGELHVINAGPSYNVVRVEPWLNTAAVGDAGVTGALSLQVANLDFDKQIELVATTDGWTNVLQFPIGARGDKNKWYWVEGFANAPGRERWQIDLDLPGPAERFEYAVVYRHGVVNHARTYEFWDNNNGNNYRIERAPQ